MTKKQRQEYVYIDKVGFTHIKNIKGRLVERLVEKKYIKTIDYEYRLYKRYDGTEEILRKKRGDILNKWECMATKNKRG